MIMADRWGLAIAMFAASALAGALTWVRARDYEKARKRYRARRRKLLRELQAET